MISMTGFGSAAGNTNTGIEIRVDISSYNKKQLDIRVVLPKEFAFLEQKIRKMIGEKLNRGSVVIKIDINLPENLLSGAFRINKALLESYHRQLLKIQHDTGIDGSPDINELVKLPGVVIETGTETELDEEILCQIVDSALQELIRMRKAEGLELAQDIKNRIAFLDEIITAIEPETEKIPGEFQQKIRENIENAGLKFNPEDEGLLKEIVIYADRHDVSEEITRIKSHIKQFDNIFTAQEPIGRKMEFILQELLREINTLGTKAAHNSISPRIIQFKTELEKIREQTANVE